MLFLSTVSLLFISTYSLPSTIYVNEAAEGNSDGESWNTAFQDLQSALKIATDQSSIWIAKGTYYPTTSKLDRNATFLLDKRLWIYGGFLGSERSIEQRPQPLPPTVLSGNIGDSSISTDNSYHVITLTSDSSFIDGLIVTGGYATDDDHSDYASCNTCFGGAIWAPCDQMRNIFLQINECGFHDNTALSGGAIFAMCQPNFNITRSRFSNNRAMWGKYKGGYGGSMMFAYMGNITVFDSTFENNIADGGGGAVHCDYGMVCEFTQCTFEGNTVTKGNGGALSMIDRDSQRGFSTLSVLGSTFRNNSAASKTAGEGGAIYLFDDDTHGTVGVSKFISNIANIGGAMSFFGESHCPGCCTSQSQNEFNDNTANNKQYNDCYMSPGFPTYQSAGVVHDPLPYLQILYNQKNNIPQPATSENTVYVNKASTKDGDGSSWTKAFIELQDGLDLVQSFLQNDPQTTVEIWVAGNIDYKTYKYTPQTIPTWYNKTAIYYDSQKSKMFEIPDNIKLFGGFVGTESNRNDRNWYKYPTLLDGYVDKDNQVYQVVHVGENVWIDGFMIANGYGDFTQPGPPGPPLKRHMLDRKSKSMFGSTDPTQILYDQTPVRGSGIFSNVSAFVAANILLYSHYSTKGSGLYVLGNPTLTHNITGYNVGFVNNYAIDRGGGLGVDLYGEMNCIGCVFINNTCSHKGGGVYSDFWSQNVFDSCVFYNNTAWDSGGALSMDAGHSKVVNCNFTQNHAFSQGGAMYTGSYNPFGGGDSNAPNHYILGNNVYDGNQCDSGLDDHYLWTYDYWVKDEHYV